MNWKPDSEHIYRIEVSEIQDVYTKGGNPGQI